MNGVFIALGANLGNPPETFARALERIEADIGEVIARSSLWHSPAWPAGEGAPNYTNAVIQVLPRASADNTLAALHAIEADFGRTRTLRNAPRTLDLDLIAFNQLMSDDSLKLPHPRLQDRPFVLLPLMEIAPAFRHPLTGQGIFDMLARLPSPDVLAHRRLAPMLAFPADSH